MKREDIEIGARVTWCSTARGGYPAIVQSIGKRIRIRAALKRRDGSWTPIFRNVNPENLSPRADFVAAVDGDQP